MSATTLVSPAPAAEPDLKWKPVLKDTYGLYSRLFRRSVGLGLLLFGAVELVREGADRSHGISPLLALLVVVVVSIAGTALESYERAAARLGSLVGVALRTSAGITFGLLFLLVPGILLAARWSVAVPVVMYEGASPGQGLRRSRELTRGHVRAIANVILTVGLRVGLVGVAFGAAAALLGGSFLATWAAGTIGAALTTPFVAHAMSVLYYRLTEPEQPVLPDPKRWGSVWGEQQP